MDLTRRRDRLFIDGEWVAPRTGAVEPVVNPATEDALGHAPVGDVADARVAVAAARRAADDGPWASMPRRERSAALTRLADVLRKQAAEIADLIVAETGTIRPVVDGLHIGGGLAHLEYCAELARRDLDESLPVNVVPRPRGSGALGAEVVRRAPVGVVAAITPFNAPFYLNLTKIAPALAMGNTVVLKPSPLTPLQGLLLGDAAAEAGLPPGVLNVVTGGVDVGEDLVANDAVDLVSFTGSDQVGSTIMAQAARGLKRVLLELGGKSASIVLADADVDTAAAAAAANVAQLTGQGCALLTRSLVHESVHEGFVARVLEHIGKVTVGDPADPAVTMGPLISAAQRDRVERYIARGVADGAAVVAGGGRPPLSRGYFVEPTIFDQVDNASTIAQEEIFGPVGVITTFATDDEAVALANDSRFGLAGAIYSADSGAAYELATRLRTGGVKINGGNLTMSVHAPFGGWKRSGLGVEHGELGALEYTNAQTISFNAG